MLSRSMFTVSALAALTAARTDLSGCTSTDVSSPAGASVAWYVPGTGELCDFLDCGGGRAPPRTDVPGCPQYSGTSTYSPSYLAGYGPTAAGAASQTDGASSSADWSSLVSAASTATSSWDLYTGTTGASYIHSPLICAIATDCPEASTSTSMWTTITSAASHGLGNSGNATVGTTRTIGNSTISVSRTVSSSTPVSTGGAAEAARSCMGAAGLIAGLGAVVAML